MKSIIVYYSLEGNTDYAAKRIAQLMGAELLRLETVKTIRKDVLANISSVEKVLFLEMCQSCSLINFRLRIMT